MHICAPSLLQTITEGEEQFYCDTLRKEKPTDKLCLGHLPVVEIIPSGDDEVLLPESSSLREELFTLHRDVSFISSTGANTEQALAEAWPTNPNTALPTGAESHLAKGRWTPM